MKSVAIALLFLLTAVSSFATAATVVITTKDPRTGRFYSSDIESSEHRLFAVVPLSFGRVNRANLYYNTQFGIRVPSTAVTYGPASITGASQISVVSDGCANQTIAANVTCWVSVQMSAAAAGSYAANYNIQQTSASDGSVLPYTFTLSGQVDLPPPRESAIECGSIIDVDRQNLAESIQIVGTKVALHYSSEFVPTTTSGQGGAFSAYFAPAWTISLHKLFDFSSARLYGDGDFSRSASYQQLGRQYYIVSADGSEAYVFDQTGKHLQTLSSRTGAKGATLLTRATRKMT